MGRRPNVTPSIKLTTTLPEDVHTRLTIHLFSPLEGKVPYGAYQAWIVERIHEYFSTVELDLAPYLGGGAFTVRGSATAIKLLEAKLKGDA
jgi:hypothetical protein